LPEGVVRFLCKYYWGILLHTCRK